MVFNLTDILYAIFAYEVSRSISNELILPDEVDVIMSQKFIQVCIILQDFCLRICAYMQSFMCMHIKFSSYLSLSLSLFLPPFLSLIYFSWQVQWIQILSSYFNEALSTKLLVIKIWSCWECVWPLYIQILLNSALIVIHYSGKAHRLTCNRDTSLGWIHFKQLLWCWWT